jgi:hypothetical protein
MLKLILICDGTSDICLADVVTWLMDEHFPAVRFRVLPARELIPARESLGVRLEKTVHLYAPDLIVCHRDAEANGIDARREEIVQASAGIDVPAVPLIPVRMLEAWLLFSEAAIRSAADNRHGDGPLQLPPIGQLETTANPKQILLTALKDASGLSARRRRAFNEQRARSLITSHVDDFSPLRRLAAFREFERTFRVAVEQLTG